MTSTTTTINTHCALFFVFLIFLCSAEVPSLCDGQEVDYWAVNRTLHFDDGVTRQVARVPIFDDSKYEGPPALPETFNVTLSVVSGTVALGWSDDAGRTPTGLYDGEGGLYSTSTVHILDEHDAPGTFQFTSSSIQVAETSRYAVLTVTRTNGASGQVSVDYSTCDLYHNNTWGTGE